MTIENCLSSNANTCAYRTSQLSTGYSIKEFGIHHISGNKTVSLAGTGSLP